MNDDLFKYSHLLKNYRGTFTQSGWFHGNVHSKMLQKRIVTDIYHRDFDLSSNIVFFKIIDEPVEIEEDSDEYYEYGDCDE
jgi:hypothetical protein